MNPVPAVPETVARLLALLERGATDAEVRALIDAAPDAVQRFHLVWCREYLIEQALRIDGLVERLRRIEPLDLRCAPRIVAFHRTTGGTGVLVSRYWACPDEQLVPVGRSRGPFTNRAKRDVVADLRRLRDYGLWHEYAHQGLAHWLLSDRTATLVLSDWAAVEPYNPVRHRNVLEDVQELLEDLPVYIGPPEAARELSAAYETYLLAPHASPASLVRLLYEAGRTLESELFERYLAGLDVAVVEEGRWAAQRAHLGVAPPAEAEVGDLWLDVVELSASVQVGTCWLSIRPVSLWQLRAWAMLPDAPGVAYSEIRNLGDPQDHREPVSAVLPAEAEVLAQYLGKVLPTVEDWKAAASVLSPLLYDGLWVDGSIDWLSARDPASPDSRLRQISMYTDPEGTVDMRDPMTGFRTAAPVKGGLARAEHVLDRLRFERSATPGE